MSQDEYRDTGPHRETLGSSFAAHTGDTGAAFEQRNAKTVKPVLGHADLITYDVAKGTVALSKNAWLSNGADDVHGELLKYNFAERKVYANPSDQSSQRVHITITPPPPSQKP